MRNVDTDFEFERRFLVRDFPQDLVADQHPNIIIQTYFLASDGFGLRIRLQATQARRNLPLTASGKDPLRLFENDFDLCILTAKGPSVGGTRYEAERELDINIGIDMCLRGGLTLSKRRFGVWLDQDGWVIDQFCGENAPLIIAECERTGPVTDLAIPQFCVAEVTNDQRYSNDSLVNRPFGTWAADDDGDDDPVLPAASYRQEFGQNTVSEA